MLMMLIVQGYQIQIIKQIFNKDVQRHMARDATITSLLWGSRR